MNLTGRLGARRLSLPVIAQLGVDQAFGHLGARRVAGTQHQHAKLAFVQGLHGNILE
jgi:hypothetical protein